MGCKVDLKVLDAYGDRRVTMRPILLAIFPMVMVMFLVFTAACYGGNDEAGVQVASAPVEKIPEGPGSLTIYSGRSKSLVDPIIDQFSHATGIDVQVKYAKTGALAATIQEEGANSPADLFFAQDPSGLGAIQAMFSPISTDLLALVPEWARAADGSWVGISGRARALVYNTQSLTAADLPADIRDLTDPKWKGRLGWAPTNGSFQAMVTGMRSSWGEAATREWLEGMVKNEAKVYPKNTPQVAAAAAGEIDIGLVNHYYLHRFMAEEGDSFAARNYHPSAGGPGSLVMVAGAGILSTSDDKENAEKFLGFMLSLAGQQYFASQTFEYPLVEGVKTSYGLVPMDQIVNPGIIPGDLTDLEGTQKLLRDVGIIP